MLNYSEDFGAAQSAQEVVEALVAASANLDVVYASHRVLHADGTGTGVTTMPRAWIEHYRTSGYDKLAPGAGRAKIISGAGGDSFEAPPTGVDWCEKETQMNAEIRELNATGSLFFSHQTAQAGVSSLVNFITDASGLQYGKWIVANGGQLRLLAANADVRLKELSGTAPRGGTLSARERDVLRWLAEGHRVDRIAEKMGLSNRTVEVHLSRARQRLGAATREQALVIALRAGLLEQLV